MFPHDPWLTASLVLTLVILWLLARQQWQRLRRRLKLRRRWAHAAKGEQQAAGLLESLGYTILEDQSQLTWTVFVDGRAVEVLLRADYIVSLAGRRYVAEVKTGDVAPSVKASATRRQLLEYRIAYDCEGVLLVDMERRRVSAVDFPGLPGGLGRRHLLRRWLPRIAISLVGLALTLWLF